MRITGAVVSPSIDWSTVLHSCVRFLTSSPWITAVASLMVLLALTRAYQRVRWLPLVLADRDPVRRFSGSQRAHILGRAGGRCEHYFLLLLRCPSRTDLQADHVHPHSRGGSTSTNNAQALCRTHNRAKNARIPFTWELRLLARRRVRYFPVTSHRVV